MPLQRSTQALPKEFDGPGAGRHGDPHPTPDPVLDDLMALASSFFRAPIAVIWPTGGNDEFHGTATYLMANEPSRGSSLLASTILSAQPLVVLDACHHESFQNDLIVSELPNIRFYAGMPLISKQGDTYGILCIMDPEPREAFSEDELTSLRRFSALAIEVLEKRCPSAGAPGMQYSELHANERYALATQATRDGIWDWNCISGEFYFSGWLREMMGLPDQDYLGTITDWLDRLHPQDAVLCQEKIRRFQTSSLTKVESEYRLRHEDGSWRWVQNRGIAIRDSAGTLLRIAGAMTDVTSRTINDPLTNLHTRVSFLNHLQWRCETASEHPRSFALLFIDLDLFKRINDSFGHATGDAVLVEFARRVERTLASDPASIAARLGGDEFAILLDDVHSEADVMTYANCVHSVLQTPVPCGMQQVRMSASIGIAMGEAKGTRAEQLLEDADLAMYRAKANGKSQSVIFCQHMRDHSLRRVELESELREAMQSSRLTLHYQPKMVLSTGKVIGFEALIRWPHPERGMVATEEFIPIAEQSNLIFDIGRWTLGEAIRQLADWRARGVVSLATTVAVNLSARQFADLGLVGNLIEQLELHQLPAACLEIEVTEGVLIQDAAAALSVLQQLKAIGVGLELDDFGVGYSSLSYLQRFPFSSLKVDRSFVQMLGVQAEGATITRSIVALGRALNLEVIAEGIETAQQESELEAMGCLYGQGYLYSKALPAKDVPQFLRKSSARQRRASSSTSPAEVFFSDMYLVTSVKDEKAGAPSA